MNKGILMSKSGKRGVILTQDGAFKKINLAYPEALIGDEVEGLSPSRIIPFPKPILTALSAACALLLILVGTLQLGGSHQAVAAYISFDINPSFEAGIDQDLHILTVEPMDKDGKTILNQIPNYKGMTLQAFSKKVALVLDKEGYFKETPQMVISEAVTSKTTNTKQKVLSDKIENAVKSIKEDKVFADHQGTLQVVKTSEQLRQTAKKEGVTAGKYILYQKAKQSQPNLSLDQAKKLTVKNLETLTKANTKVTHSTIKPSKETPAKSSQTVSPVNKGETNDTQLKKPHTSAKNVTPSKGGDEAVSKGEQKGKGMAQVKANPIIKKPLNKTIKNQSGYPSKRKIEDQSKHKKDLTNPVKTFLNRWTTIENRFGKQPFIGDRSYHKDQRED